VDDGIIRLQSDRLFQQGKRLVGVPRHRCGDERERAKIQVIGVADYYLKVAIRGLVGRSMTIPAFNDSALPAEMKPDIPVERPVGPVVW
jgi:hypothetical protein